MKRLERLTALLSFLQSRRFTSIREIEDRFQISQRTIYRDLNSLDESGVPISFEKNKGYFILGRHFLPPLSLTVEEAKSFVFVEQLAKKYTDEQVFKNFSSALEKIKNKLKYSQLTDMETMAPRILAYIDDDYTPKYLHLVEQACSAKKVLSIDYQDIKKNRTTRVIEPIGMTFYSQNWHIIAFCRLRNDYRDFVLPRIDKIQILNEYIQENRLTLLEYINEIERD